MTDKEKLKKLFDEFGVGYREEDTDIICFYKDKKIEGYIDFWTIFEFNTDGKFQNMGAYEG